MHTGQPSARPMERNEIAGQGHLRRFLHCFKQTRGSKFDEGNQIDMELKSRTEDGPEIGEKTCHATKRQEGDDEEVNALLKRTKQ